MKFIPPGEFLMGSSEEEVAKIAREAKEVGNIPEWHIENFAGEAPQRTVTLTKPFAISMYEVTRGQFRQFVDATGYRTDAEKDGKGSTGWKDGSYVESPEILWNTNPGFDSEPTDDHPVVNVTWNDAQAFCQWLSEKEGVTYRLPTEAQWEHSCRAGVNTRFCFGDDDSMLNDYSWYGWAGGKGTRPVGRKKVNSFGITTSTET